MIRFSGSGDSLAAQAQGFGLALARVVTVAIAGGTAGAKEDLRRQLLGAGYKFDRAANAIRGDVYPRPPHVSPSAAGVIHPSGPSAERYLTAFAQGAVITPKHGRALAIPLHDFRGWDRRLVGPTSSYWGGKLIFIQPRSSAAVMALGMIGILASKADTYSVGRRWSRSTPLRRVASGHTPVGLIPQFLLVSAVRLPKLMDAETTMARWADRLPALAAEALAIMDV